MTPHQPDTDRLAGELTGAASDASVASDASAAAPNTPSSHDILDQLALAVMVLDDAWRIQRWNRQAEKLFGVPKSQARGRTFATVVPLLERLGLEPHLVYVLAARRPLKLLEIPVPESALTPHSDSERLTAIGPGPLVEVQPVPGTLPGGRGTRHYTPRGTRLFHKTDPSVSRFFDFMLDPVELPRTTPGPPRYGVTILVADATERAQLRLSLASKTEDQEMLFQVSNALRGTMTISGGLFIVLSALAAREGAGFDLAAIFLADEATQSLRGQMAVGPLALAEAQAVWRDLANRERAGLDFMTRLADHPPHVFDNVASETERVQAVSLPLAPDGGIVASCILGQQTITGADRAADPALAFSEPVAALAPFERFACVPLLASGRSLGALLVDSSDTPREFDPEVVRLLDTYALQAALAIDNAYIYERAVREGHTDSLTGLDNHGYFQESLKRAVLEARRYNKPVALLMADLDYFKHFNDTYGHQAGDTILAGFAGLLRAAVRDTDRPARYGGEEFAVILPHTGAAEAHKLAERLRERVDRELRLSEQPGAPNVTVSLGVAAFPEHAIDARALITAADRALFHAKHAGRNRVCLAGRGEDGDPCGC